MNKRVFACLLLMLFCVFFAVSADDPENFEISSDGVLVKYLGKSSFVRIPDGVTAIGESAFILSNPVSVIIPEGVTSIGARAFQECYDLKTISIPKSVTSIGSMAFASCSSLEKITIPDGVTSIGWGAFSGCDGLTSIIVPDSVISIGDEAFGLCDNLKSVKIPASVTSIKGDILFASDSAALIVDRGSYAEDYAAGLRYHPYMYSDGEMYRLKRVNDIDVYDDYYEANTAAILYPDGTAALYAPGTTLNDVSWTLYDAVITLTAEGESIQGTLAGDIMTLRQDDDIMVFKRTSLITEDNNAETSSKLTGYPDFDIDAEGVLMDYSGNAAEVKIPDGVTAISSSAFGSCGGITSVTIPDSVTYIEGNPFARCDALAEINVSPDHPVFYFSNGAFLNKNTDTLINYLQSNDASAYEITDGITSIGDDAFRNCTNLTSVTIPDSVMSIGSGAFAGCSGLTWISIPVGVTKINRGTFENCDNLAAVILPIGVTSIKDAAFSGCAGLSFVNIPSSADTIANDAFNGCDQLKLMVKKGSYAERYASDKRIEYKYMNGDVYKLETLDGYKLGFYVIYNEDTMIATLYPDGSLSIEFNGKKLDARSWKLKGKMLTIDISGQNKMGTLDGNNLNFYWENHDFGLTKRVSSDTVFPDQQTASTLSRQTSIGNEPEQPEFEIDDKGILVKYNGSSAEVTIPGNVTSIGDSAFYENSTLVSVTIPDGVTSIGEKAFWECTGLASVTIPDSVTSIGKYAFYDCSSLTSVTIPSGVMSIEWSVFDGCSSLTSVTIPGGVTSIGRDAFSGCSSLTSISIPDSVNYIGESAFYGCSSLTSVTIPDSVNYIGESAFTDCSSLSSITIPNGVSEVAWGAFSGCSSLTTVTLPDSITSIEKYAFADCSSLSSIIIPNGAVSIEDDAFSGCEQLSSVTIPGSVTRIGDYAFDEQRNIVLTVKRESYAEEYALKKGFTVEYSNDIMEIDDNGVLVKYHGEESEVVIPDGVTAIGERAFYGRSSLVSVTIPDSVTSIGPSAFQECSNLTSVSIPDGVTSVRYNTFESCTSLTTVSLPDSVTSIEAFAFYNCNRLTTINIPDGVTSIGDVAFGFCVDLASLTIPYSVTSIDNSVFSYCDQLILSVGKGSYAEQYAKDNGINYEYADLKQQSSQSTMQQSRERHQITFITDDGSMDPLYRDFLDFLSDYIAAENKEAITVNNDIYKSCLDNINGAWRSINETGYALCDIDSNGTAELLLGNYKYKDLWFVYTIIDNQITEVLHGGYKDIYVLNDDGTFTEDRMVSAFSGGNNCYSYENGKIRKLVSAEHGFDDLYNEDLTLNENAKEFWNVSFEDEGSSEIMQVTKDVYDSIFDSYKPVEIEFKPLLKEFSYRILDNGTAEITLYAGNGPEVTIPSVIDGYSITSIGEKAFSGFSSLTSVIISDGITSVGNEAFKYCHGLTSVTMPDSVESIGQEAFFQCDKLSSITIPDSLTFIGKEAFGLCSSLSKINVSLDHPVFATAGGALINKTERALIIYAAANSAKSYNIPQGVITIGQGAFKNCTNLTSVTIPESVRSIEFQAFSGCKNLSELAVPPSVSSIGNMAFNGCDQLVLKVKRGSYSESYAVSNGIRCSYDDADGRTGADRDEYSGDGLRRTGRGERVGNCPMISYLQKGDMVFVPDSVDTGINIRKSPGGDKTGVQAFPRNENGIIYFPIEDGPVCKDNKVWYEVNFIGHHGWIAEGADGEYYLQRR